MTPGALPAGAADAAPADAVPADAVAPPVCFGSPVAADGSSAALPLSQAIGRFFRPLGRRVQWLDRDLGRGVAGWLLQGGILFPFDPGNVWCSRGDRRAGRLEAEGGDGGAIDGLGPLAIDMADQAFGVWGAFDREAHGHPLLREEAERTLRWIREGLGPSEFAWDTLAVERSMLRPMMAAVYLRRQPGQWSLVHALLAGSGLPPFTIAVAAAMAEFDGKGKVLANDYYLNRPGRGGGPGARDLLHPHLLVCCGHFLSNYKRRFLIQNAPQLDDPQRVAMHRTLLVCDMTQEAHRAVLVDWSRHGEPAGEARERRRRMEAKVAYSEHFDCAIRLWRLLRQPDEAAASRVGEVCHSAARCLAERREAQARSGETPREAAESVAALRGEEREAANRLRKALGALKQADAGVPFEQEIHAQLSTDG